MNIAARDYFRERAEAEIDRGNAARDFRTACAHYLRADFLLACAERGTANEN